MENVASLSQKRRRMIDAQPAPPKPYGWHWELMHTTTRAVVKSGFARQDVCPNFKSDMRGYHYAYTAVYARP
jgi:hypothetical protein